MDRMTEEGRQMSEKLEFYEGRLIHYREQAGLILRVWIAVTGILVTGLASLAPEIMQVDVSKIIERSISLVRDLSYVSDGFAELIFGVLSLAMLIFILQILRSMWRSVEEAYLTIHPGRGEESDGWLLHASMDIPGNNSTPSDSELSSAYRELEYTGNHLQNCLNHLKATVMYGILLISVALPLLFNQPNTTVFITFPMIMLLAAEQVFQRLPLSTLLSYLSIHPLVDLSFIVLAIAAFAASWLDETSLLLSLGLLLSLLIPLSVIIHKAKQENKSSIVWTLKREFARFGGLYITLGFLSLLRGKVGSDPLMTIVTSLGVSSLYLIIFLLISLVLQSVIQD